MIKIFFFAFWAKNVSQLFCLLHNNCFLSSFLFWTFFVFAFFTLSLSTHSATQNVVKFFVDISMICFSSFDFYYILGQKRGRGVVGHVQKGQFFMINHSNAEKRKKKKLRKKEREKQIWQSSIMAFYTNKTKEDIRFCKKSCSTFFAPHKSIPNFAELSLHLNDWLQWI